MDTTAPALIHTLGNWLYVLQEQDAEEAQVFERVFPDLHAEVAHFGMLLEELEEKGAEVPDVLFQVATNLFQVLDIAWDSLQGASGAEDFAEAYQLLQCSLVAMTEEKTALENLFESMASEQSGVEL
ncbi:hypothetical protein ABS71_02880 [bacterium SCN 62-11]|nr:MAG: hypothetical protein ABS71_02880 [bacterium SCN 62-11]